VVLDVARSALGIVRDGVDHPLALELAENDVVRPADGVRDHVQAPSMRHPEDDLPRASGRGQLDRLVEHGNHRVEAFDRELLLAEERAPQVPLEALHLRETGE
jgi:hypothetical protein